MGLCIHFINRTDSPINAKVNHVGCGEQPMMDGRLQCWWTTVEPKGPNGVYCPSDWVIDFSTWMGVILEGLATIAVTVATAGTATPEVVAAEVMGEGAAEAAEGATDAIEAASAVERMQEVASSLKTSWQGLSKVSRFVISEFGSQAVAIPSAVGFEKACGDWGFYYAQNGKIYRAKTVIQVNGDYVFVISRDTKDLWEYVGEGD
jgi:hypothetical protein